MRKINYIAVGIILTLATISSCSSKTDEITNINIIYNNEIVNSLNALLKNYQLEINFKEEKESNEDQEESIDDMQHTSKGSKSFIEQMMKDEENEEDS